MAEYSDSDRALSDLQKLIDGISFAMPGRDESLGKDMAKAVAHGIADLAANQLQADGEAFPENAEWYADWKSRKYGMAPPAFGYRTGQMFSLESLYGITTISTDEVLMRYGVEEPPKRSSASSYLGKGDQKATDRQKLGWQMERFGIRVYEVGDLVLADVMEVVRDGLSVYFATKGVA